MSMTGALLTGVNKCSGQLFMQDQHPDNGFPSNFPCLIACQGFALSSIPPWTDAFDYPTMHNPNGQEHNLDSAFAVIHTVTFSEYSRQDCKYWHIDRAQGVRDPFSPLTNALLVQPCYLVAEVRPNSLSYTHLAIPWLHTSLPDGNNFFGPCTNCLDRCLVGCQLLQEQLACHWPLQACFC